MTDAVSSLALLNLSQSVTGQGTIGVSAFAVAIGAFILGTRRPYLRRKHLRRAAYLFLATAVGTLIFKMVSVPWLDRYELEPLAHMAEEVGTMGGFSYLAWYLSRKFINVRERPWLKYQLALAPRVYIACWIVCAGLGIAALLGLLPPFPMSELHVQLPEWSVVYRAVILLPGVFYAALFSWAFFDRARYKDTDPTLAIRGYLAGTGTLLWSIICGQELAWAATQAFASPHVREAMVEVHVTTEGTLYVAQAALWMAFFAIPYAPTRDDRDIAHHQELQLLLRELKYEMIGARNLVPSWHTTLDRLHQAGTHLHLKASEMSKVQSSMCVMAVIRSDDRNFSREEARHLVRLRDDLSVALPPSGEERRRLVEDPIAEAVETALLLTENLSEIHLDDKDQWIQLQAAVTLEDGNEFLRPLNTHYRLSREVLTAWTSTKMDQD